MKKLSNVVVFVLGLSFFPEAKAGIERHLLVKAEDSILEYFATAGRDVKTIHVETYAQLPSRDYLVEAQVFAESYLSDEIVEYHCGVFVFRTISRWESRQTACEPLPSYGMGGRI